MPMQIRILTVFAKFSSIQYTFLAKSRISPTKYTAPFTRNRLSSGENM